MRLYKGVEEEGGERTGGKRGKQEVVGEVGK